MKEVAAGLKVADACRMYGISEATYYVWKTKYEGMTTSDVKKMKALVAENAQLKKLVASQAFDIFVIKDMLTKKF